MISDTDKVQLVKIKDQIERFNQVSDWPEIVAGGISMAFHIGQISTLRQVVSEITRLADTEGSDVCDDNRAWACGYVDAANALLEILNDSIETLKQSFDGKTKLADLTDGPAVRHPQD